MVQAPISWIIIFYNRVSVLPPCAVYRIKDHGAHKVSVSELTHIIIWASCQKKKKKNWSRRCLCQKRHKRQVEPTLKMISLAVYHTENNIMRHQQQAKKISSQLMRASCVALAKGQHLWQSSLCEGQEWLFPGVSQPKASIRAENVNPRGCCRVIHLALSNSVRFVLHLWLR